jgi:glucose-1-phosphate adenylyltransferase
MPRESSPNFGVIEVDKNHHVRGFQEKPAKPKTVPKRPKEIYASMGIYLFSRDALLKELEIDAKSQTSENDFGKNVIPQMLANKKRVYVHNFVDENKKPKYWRDIGTRDAYYQANMDLLDRNSEFHLYNRAWPVRTYHEQYPPIKIINTRSGTGSLVNSMVAGGCVIEDGVVERSILSSNVKIHSKAQVKNSVIMEGVTIGAHSKIRNAIIDKEVIVPPKSSIGYDLNLDKKRFVLTASGIVIVAKKSFVPSL